MSSFGERLRLAVISFMASLLIRSLRRTLRLTYRNREALDRARGNGARPCILAFWHGRLLMMRYAYAGRKISVLISRHRDGELIARTLARFGIPSIRGSSSSGGAAALRETVRAVKGGRDVAFTPDGPRGPRHVVQPGVIEAARLSGASIVPVSFAATPRWTLRSWDGFVIPRPFGRGLFLYGDPFPVPGTLRGDQVEKAREELERRMVSLERQADEMVRAGGGDGRDR